GGVYPITFTATNSAGSAPQNFTLSVNQAPAITTAAANQTACIGATATFTAAASGFPAPTVQWQLSTDGGTNFTNIAGATSTSYSTTTGANGYQYRAHFTNGVGAAAETTATLTINPLPSITTNPANQTVCAGATATFTAAATGSTGVQWQVSADGTNFSNIAGATSTTLSFVTVAGDNNKQYRAVFTNSCGPTNTAAATLTVNTAPLVTTNPTNQTACNGTTATFTAA